MFWIKFKRIVQSGWSNFKRNGLVSYASILVATITLSVITGLFLFHAVLSSSIRQLQDKVDIAIYFRVDAPEDQILLLQDTLKNLPEVARVDYSSADEQVLLFRNRHSDDYLTIQALDELGDNPFGGLLLVKAKDSTQYESIAKVLEGDSQIAKDSSQIIERINYSQNKIVINKLNKLIAGAKDIGTIVTLILGVISVVIMFTTIRLTIYMAKEEISIMRLVGASGRYVSAPFLIEGVFYGFFAWLITGFLFWPITYFLGQKATDLIGINLYNYYYSNFFYIGGWVLLIGIFLGVISSILAIRKYLNI